MGESSICMYPINQPGAVDSCLCTPFHIPGLSPGGSPYGHLVADLWTICWLSRWDFSELDPQQRIYFLQRGQLQPRHGPACPITCPQGSVALGDRSWHRASHTQHDSDIGSRLPSPTFWMFSLTNSASCCKISGEQGPLSHQTQHMTLQEEKESRLGGPYNECFLPITTTFRSFIQKSLATNCRPAHRRAS